MHSFIITTTYLPRKGLLHAHFSQMKKKSRTPTMTIIIHHTPSMRINPSSVPQYHPPPSDRLIHMMTQSFLSCAYASMVHLFVIAESNGTLGSETVTPETVDRSGVTGVGSEEPEAKDWLGENIQNSVGNDLSVD